MVTVAFVDLMCNPNGYQNATTLEVNVHNDSDLALLRENGSHLSLRRGIANCPMMKTITFVGRRSYNYFGNLTIMPTTLDDCKASFNYDKAQDTIEFFRDCVMLQTEFEEPLRFDKMELAPVIMKLHLRHLRRHVIGNCLFTNHVVLAVDPNATPKSGVRSLVAYMKTDHVRRLTLTGNSDKALEVIAIFMASHIKAEPAKPVYICDITVDCTRSTYRQFRNDDNIHHLHWFKLLVLALPQSCQIKLHIIGMSVSLWGLRNLEAMSEGVARSGGAIILENICLDTTAVATNDEIKKLQATTQDKGANFLPILPTDNRKFDQSKARLLLDSITFAMGGRKNFTQNSPIVASGPNYANCDGLVVVSLDHKTHIFLPVRSIRYFQPPFITNFGHTSAQLDFWNGVLKTAATSKNVLPPLDLEGIDGWAEAMTLSAWMDSQQFCFPQLISRLKPLVNPPLPSNNGGDNGGSNGGATPNKRARIFGP